MLGQNTATENGMRWSLCTACVGTPVLNSARRKSGTCGVKKS